MKWFYTKGKTTVTNNKKGKISSTTLPKTGNAN